MARKSAKNNDEEESATDKIDDNVAENENIPEIEDEGEEDQLKIDDKEEELLMES